MVDHLKKRKLNREIGKVWVGRVTDELKFFHVTTENVTRLST